MVREEVSEYACLAECRIHDVLSVIALESESGYYKAHVGCHGYLYTTGSSSLIRLVWGRRRLSKTLCCTQSYAEKLVFPSTALFWLILLLGWVACSVSLILVLIHTLLTAPKPWCSLMPFLKDGKIEAQKLNNWRTAAIFCQCLYWDFGWFYSCSCTQACVKGTSVVSVIWMHLLLQRLGQGHHGGGVAGQRKCWDTEGNLGEPRKRWRLQLASISGSQWVPPSLTACLWSFLKV